ncbi:alkaline phosphatase family protein [Oceanicoccus sp. KOV_DT_Chl]|uniref:alkaline phosphatase family protein n=1 Tax=Oceanicoccus sp. KOV_DT_Chl TaxID=1904639 RepID=UPI000C7B2EFF|nr:ectonucleotide pyrophosphatase/phosphodiesterase [Oceanicoccus sp. KOV_DT_Chl]
MLKYLLTMSYLLLGASAVVWAEKPEQQYVIMISIDGLRPEIYLNPDAKGLKVPNLRALAASGTRAERMISVFPSVTYPAHTSLVTGVNPANHGIVNNFKGQSVEWYLQAADIKAQTLWQSAQQQGLQTAIVTWPATYGANVDYLVPENLSFGLSNPVEAIRQGSTPGLYEALAEEGAPTSIASFDHPDGGQQLDELTTHLAVKLIQKKTPQLLLVHFLDADHRQHFSGPDDAGSMHSFELIDQSIGKLRDAVRQAGLEHKTNFIIVGDHGFVPVHTGINVYALLRQLAGGDRAAMASLTPMVLGGSGAFYPGEQATPEQVAEMTAKFKHFTETKLRHLVSFVAKDDLEKMGSYPGAAFALAAASGYMLTGAKTPEVFLPLPAIKGMHGYLPEMPEMATGFIASGPAFREGYTIPFIRMIDVAPTIAKLWGAKLEEADGVAVTGIYRQTNAISDDPMGFKMGNDH